jgi:hypothetical protein
VEQESLLDALASSFPLSYHSYIAECLSATQNFLQPRLQPAAPSLFPLRSKTIIPLQLPARLSQHTKPQRSKIPSSAVNEIGTQRSGTFVEQARISGLQYLLKLSLRTIYLVESLPYGPGLMVAHLAPQSTVLLSIQPLKTLSRRN